MTSATASRPPPLRGSATLPRVFVVRHNRQDTRDTHTLWLEPDGGPFGFRAGQFTMLQVFGAGEIPVSISGDPRQPEVLQHTVRDVGAASHALAVARPGSRVGVRGPYGTGWEVDRGRGGDVVVVAGGIGLAPLRPALLDLCADRSAYGEVSLLYGARTPEELLYEDDLRRWGDAHRIDVQVTVDRADERWRGRVGLVTGLVDRIRFDPEHTQVLVCGPEVMMRHTAAAFLDRGVPADAVRVSLERNMKCGVGLCGHCQLRELIVCTDGPVLDYDRVAALLTRAEL